MLGTLRNRKGFTLVELAIVLVIIGIILGAVLKGQELINNAKAKRIINDTKGLMALAYTFYDRYGRFPGDCDNSGNVDYTTLTTISTTFSATAAPAFCYVPPGTIGAQNAPNPQWNEMLQAQIVSGDPRSNATSVFSGGGARYLASTTINAVPYTIIVNTRVPCYAAKAMDQAIDGNLDAGLGAIREISGGVVRTATDAWSSCATAGTGEQTLVNVAYFIDKRPGQ